MAEVIYKYGPLSRHLPSTMKVKGVPVRFGMQRGLLYCWCVVNPDDHGPDVDIDIVGTGESYCGFYIDTVEDQNGFIWHLILTETY
jgi:hypothetical protein